MCAIQALIRPQTPPTSGDAPMRPGGAGPAPGAAPGTQTPAAATPWPPEVPQTTSQWHPGTLRGDSDEDRLGNVQNMEKLTQFVSKSFESNNNGVADCLNLAKECAIKSEDDLIQEETKPVEEQSKTKPVAKNWLISDSPKTSPTLGVDLRLNSSHVVCGPAPECKWFENDVDVKSPSPKNTYSSSSSPPIDLEDSKSCDRTEEDKQPSAIPKESASNDKKLCELVVWHALSWSTRKEQITLFYFRISYLLDFRVETTLLFLLNPTLRSPRCGTPSGIFVGHILNISPSVVIVVLQYNKILTEAVKT